MESFEDNMEIRNVVAILLSSLIPDDSQELPSCYFFVLVLGERVKRGFLTNSFLKIKDIQVYTCIPASAD